MTQPDPEQAAADQLFYSHIELFGIAYDPTICRRCGSVIGQRQVHQAHHAELDALSGASVPTNEPKEQR